MAKEKKLIKFYIECMNCKNTKEECSKIWKDFKKLSIG